jgi:hypothetical protein
MPPDPPAADAVFYNQRAGFSAVSERFSRARTRLFLLVLLVSIVCFLRKPLKNKYLGYSKSDKIVVKSDKIMV